MYAFALERSGRVRITAVCRYVVFVLSPFFCCCCGPDISFVSPAPITKSSPVSPPPLQCNDLVYPPATHVLSHTQIMDWTWSHLCWVNVLDGDPFEVRVYDTNRSSSPSVDRTPLVIVVRTSEEDADRTYAFVVCCFKYVSPFILVLNTRYSLRRLGIISQGPS